ncbi:MAG: GNAT family N-acetyltransferase [Bacteriovoracaceae bacterium]
MPDLLVKLYNLPTDNNFVKTISDTYGIEIKRALSLDKHLVLEFIKNNFNINWVNECELSFAQHPIKTFVAIKDKKIIGFSCYDATCLGFFGPMGVTESERGKGIGKALLVKTLSSMREQGYGYSIIGWVEDAIEFYSKTVGATLIENSTPGIYRDMIEY